MRGATTQVGSLLGPGESLLVDHYLGKGSVRAIEELRRTNIAAGSRLGAAFATALGPESQPRHAATVVAPDALRLRRVEVAMVESVDCAGRTWFYDDYGVVRDVMQNHVSQMLALALCAVGSDAGDAGAYNSTCVACGARSTGARLLTLPSPPPSRMAARPGRPTGHGD